MIRFHSLLAAVVVAGAALVFAEQPGSNAAALFQQGLLLERAEGNVTQAIVLYERVVAEYPKDTSVVPQALSHLAQIYERRSDVRAARMWSRLARDFGGTPYGAEARRRMSETGAQAPGPFRSRVIDLPEGVANSEAAPDGQSIAFVRRSGSASELWIRDIDSGRDRRRFSEGGRAIESVAWSPDSRRMLVATSPANGKPGEFAGWDLRVMDAQGGQGRTLATIASGRILGHWSPDSRWVVADLGQNFPPVAMVEETRLIDTTTGQSRKLAGPGLPTTGAMWSRDGRQLVYQTQAAGEQPSFWTTTVDGAESRPWTVPLELANGSLGLPFGMTRTWTTDDRVFVSQRGSTGASFFLVPAAGGAAEKACETRPGQIVCQPAMTPDGRVRVALDTSAQRLMLLDLGKVNAPRRLTTGFGREASPAISPDGRLVAFASNPNGEWELQVVPTDRAPADAVQVGPLGFERFVSPAWTPAGRLVGKITTAESDIFRVNLDANGRAIGAPARMTQDTRGNNWPAISPDGKHVAYTYDLNRAIAVMTADGAAERPLQVIRTRGPINWRSADEVLFRRVTEGPVPNAGPLSSLNIKTGAMQTLVELPAGVIPWQYVASKNEVFYAVPAPGAGRGASGARAEIRAKSISTGADRVVAQITDLVTTLDLGFRVSPDGAHVAYTRWVKAGNATRPELHLMAIDGQGDRVLGQPEGSVDWSSDGRRLLYFAENSLKVFDAVSAQSWSISGTGDTDTVEWDDARWAPDGSFIVLSRDRWRDEHRVFDGLTYDAVVKAMGAKR